MDWQAEYLREKEEKDKLYIACGKLKTQLHTQAEELARCYVEIVELKDSERKL